MKENIFAIIALVVIGIMLINSTVQNCELKKQQEKIVNMQLGHSKQLQQIISEEIIKHRDTVKLADTYITLKTIEREKIKYEIYKTTNIDSLVRLYFKFRPDTGGGF